MKEHNKRKHPQYICRLLKNQLAFKTCLLHPKVEKRKTSFRHSYNYWLISIKYHNRKRKEYMLITTLS